MATFQRDGLDIAYEVHGAGVPVLLLHGVTVSFAGNFGAGFEFPHDGMVAEDEAVPGKFAFFASIGASHAFIPANKEALAAMHGWFNSAVRNSA